MGKTNRQQGSQDELIALHAALWRAGTESGAATRLIPTKEWESILARCLNVATRQTAQDKTWAMDRRGLIERVNREGIRLLPPTTEATP